jgi:hypothetical protein
VPKTPRDLRSDRCINLRLASAGTIYRWEFERGAEKVEIAVDGPLVFDAGGMVTHAALAGIGLGYVLEDRALDHFKSVALVRILADWCRPSPALPVRPGQAAAIAGARRLHRCDPCAKPAKKAALISGNALSAPISWA